MAPKKPMKPKDTTKKTKKKVSILVAERVDYIDYKDVNLLRRFMSDRAKIRARRVTANDTQQQREVATAIKNARFMALLPYASRVTTQRAAGKGERGDRGDRGDRGERGAPRGEAVAEAPIDEVEVGVGADDGEE